MKKYDVKEVITKKRGCAQETLTISIFLYLNLSKVCFNCDIDGIKIHFNLIDLIIINNMSACKLF